MILDSWLSDIPAQFRGKEKIEILMSAFADEMDELVKVFDELKALTDIDSCVGQQLDNIGDIVSMARKDAYTYLLKSQDLVVSDEGYRNVLKYKILQNTSDCTYADIVHGIKLLWGEYPVKYKEDDSQPATYILDLGTYSIDDSSALLKRTLTIRAGGVKVLFLITYTGGSVKWLDGAESLLESDTGRLRTYTSRIITMAVIDHIRGTRVWDGTWLLDGTYQLDASSENKIRIIQYCKSNIGGEQIYSPRVQSIPGRLIVTASGDIWVVDGEGAVTGIRGNELEPSAEEDSMAISSYGDAVVTEDAEYTMVSSDQELSVEAAGYICSNSELYSEFSDDGLTIYYGSDAEFDLEMVETYL